MPRVPPILLRSRSDAEKAKGWIDRALKAGGYEVQFKQEGRTSEQNARMWAMLSIIARARPEWNGVRMTPDRWKSTFMDALGMEVDFVPKLDATGFIPVGHRSSQLTKQEFSDLFEVIEAFAAREGIDLGDHQNNGSSQRKAS